MSQSVKTMGNKNKTAINKVIGLEYMNAMDISDQEVFNKTSIDHDMSLQGRTKDSTAMGAPSPYNQLSSNQKMILMSDLKSSKHLDLFGQDKKPDNVLAHIGSIQKLNNIGSINESRMTIN